MGLKCFRVADGRALLRDFEGEIIGYGGGGLFWIEWVWSGGRLMGLTRGYVVNRGTDFTYLFVPWGSFLEAFAFGSDTKSILREVSGCEVLIVVAEHVS